MMNSTTPLESLLEHVPPAVVYRRVPLDPRRNAIELWRPAVEYFVKPNDEKDLWGELIYGSIEMGRSATFLSVADEGLVRALLKQNSTALQLLYEGVDRGQFQFRDFQGLDQIPADSEFVCKLGELARLPFIRFKILAADGDFAAAGEELVRLLLIGEMICNGDGQVLHYLIGLWIRSAALRGIERLSRHPEVPGEVFEGLLAVIERSLNAPDGLSQSLRVDFCSISLPQLDRTVEDPDLETVVDRVLELYYVPRRDPASPTREIRQIATTDHWLGQRRQQILFLLEDHPNPFDKIGTARLMGSLVAETIRDLNYAERTGLLDFAGRLHRLRRQFRRGRLERRTRYWPVELTPGFLFESSRRSDMEPYPEGVVGSVSAGRGLVTDTALAAARKNLRRTANPIGLILVEHLLAFDYGPFMFQHRAKLKEVRRKLRKRLQSSS